MRRSARIEEVDDEKELEEAAEDEEAIEDAGAPAEQPRAKRQRANRCDVLTRKVIEMEKKMSNEQGKVRLLEEKPSTVKRENQALEKSRMMIDKLERALVQLRGELQAARQLAADKAVADKKRSEMEAEKEEVTRNMTETGAMHLVTIRLKYRSRFDNRSDEANAICTHVHDEFMKLVEKGDLQQTDGRSSRALEKRFNIELNEFRLWASAANRAVAFSGVLPAEVEEKVRAHWRSTTCLFRKYLIAQWLRNPLGDDDEEEEKEHVEECTVDHPVSAGPPRRGHTVCGGGGEGSSSSNSVYRGPDVRGEDDDDPLGDDEEEEHVEERTVVHPVSAGPPRIGHTVCGGGGGVEGSRGNSVSPGPDVRGKDRDDAPHDGVFCDAQWAERHGPANIYYATASPTAAHELEVLPSDDYERGNVRKYPSGLTLPIDAAAADNMRQGRRKNRPGLCYEEHGFYGFNPALWPHVFAAPMSGFGHHDAMLQQHPDLGTFGYTQVSVIYEPKPNPKLVGVAETFWEAHKPVRDTDPSAGGMVGTGEHLRRDGHVANFVVADAEARARVAGGMECAGKAFVKRWTGARVGFEALLGHQRRLWRAKSRDWPLCWNMSDGLGNAEHIDPDGFRCYAVWLSKLGHAGSSRSWWMLFPRHGLAIELCHGCWISWDGRVQPHCTAVPQVAEGDRLLSLFCSLPANAMGVLQRKAMWCGVMHDRAYLRPPLVPGDGPIDVDDQATLPLRGRSLFESLEIGMPVVYRYVKDAPANLASKAARKKWGRSCARFCRGAVVTKTETHVTILDSNGFRRVQLNVVEVNNRLWPV